MFGVFFKIIEYWFMLKILKFDILSIIGIYDIKLNINIEKLVLMFVLKN